MRLGEDSSIGTEEIRRKTMGRAIDMEKDIDTLKKELSEIKSMLKEKMEGVDSAETETKKTNTKRSKASNKQSDTRPKSDKSED